MSLLQRFGFNESRYERPTQRWVCGHAAEGRGCNAGPDRRGECRATYECYPNRVGDRWQCTRDALAGGRCEDGPHPDGRCSRSIPRCLPVRSLRYRRGRLALWLSVATLGAVLALLTSPWRLDLVSAGDLSFAHGGASTRCGDCHAAAHESLAGWLATAFDPPSGVEESRRCVACHPLGKAVMQPHSVAAPHLAALTREAQAGHGGPGGDARLPHMLGMDVDRDAAGNLACMSCHREHRGQDFDLGRIGDSGCQGCHVVTFASLADGHPEITGYTFGRRTRLAFDHLSHRDKHYPEQEQPFACAACHLTEGDGGRMRVTGFAAACSTCHGGQVEGEGQAGDKGVRVLGVPGLDLYFVRDHGAAIGEWPADADAELPAIMRLLLTADPQFVASERQLAGLDLLDLEKADAQLAGALEGYVWSIKRLLHELQEGGQETLRRRLERCLERPLGTGELAALTGLLPPEVIDAAQRAWFPNLADELRRHDRGEAVPYVNSGAGAGAGAGDGEADAAPGGDQAAAAAGSGGIRAADGSTADILGDGEPGDDILGGEESGGDILGAETPGDDIPVAEAPAGDILGGDDAAPEDGDILGDLGDGDAPPGDSTEVAPEAADEQPPVAVDAEAWVRAGGWYRRYYTLLYRPTGHDDRFLPGWLDITGHGAAPEVTAVFRLLADPKAPGLCTKCHSVDAAADGSLRVNWTGLRSVPDERRFTEFRHVAHLSLLEQDGCLLCHNWREESQGEVMAAYEGTDPAVRAGNFAPFRKATCSGCHGPGMASDSCLTCHNYHVGIFPQGEILQARHQGGERR